MWPFGRQAKPVKVPMPNPQVEREREETRKAKGALAEGLVDLDRTRINLEALMATMQADLKRARGYD